MIITLELPRGGEPPKLKGVLTGPPDDLKIEVRLADLIAATAAVVENGGAVSITHPVTGTLNRFEKPKRAPIHRATKKAARKPANSTPQPATETAAISGPYIPAPGSVPDLILRTLGNDGPASSLELTDKIGHEKSGAIYQAVKFLRAKGLVDGFEDEKDGTRRWKLAQ